MTRHRTVYITQRPPVHQNVARAACPEQLELVMLVSPSAFEIVDAVGGAEFLVSERSGAIDASIIEAGSGLRLIQRLGMQIHDIDLDAARRARIPVCRWPLPQCTMVAEHAVMQVMALLKRSREAERIVAEASAFGPSRAGTRRGGAAGRVHQPARGDGGQPATASSDLTTTVRRALRRYVVRASGGSGCDGLILGA